MEGPRYEGVREYFTRATQDVRNRKRHFDPSMLAEVSRGIDEWLWFGGGTFPGSEVTTAPRSLYEKALCFPEGSAPGVIWIEGHCSESKASQTGEHVLSISRHT